MYVAIRGNVTISYHLRGSLRLPLSDKFGQDPRQLWRLVVDTVVVMGTHLSAAQLDDLVARATVDAYADDEQLTGLFTMIAEHLAVPFETVVLGMEVIVEKVDLRSGSGIVAVCTRGRHRQAIGVLDLPLPDPPPRGVEWIEAYRHWGP